MSIQARRVQKANPQQPGGVRKYYLIPKSRGKMGIKEMSNHIGKRTTINVADSVGTLNSLAELVPEMAAEGWIIDLSPLGSFMVTLETEGELNPKDLTAKNVKRFKLKFNPSQQVEDMLKNIKIEIID